MADVAPQPSGATSERDDVLGDAEVIEVVEYESNSKSGAGASKGKCTGCLDLTCVHCWNFEMRSDDSTQKGMKKRTCSGS